MSGLEANVVLWGLVVLLAIAGIYLKGQKNKKVSARNSLAGAGILLIVLLLIGMPIPFIDAPDADIPGIPDDDDVVTTPTTTEVKLYDQVTVSTHEMGSDSYSAIAGTVHFFEEGVDISAANAQALDTATIASGSGNTTSGKLSSGTNYQVILEPSAGYDIFLNGKALQQLPYVKTTTGTISNIPIKFSNVMSYVTIGDMIDESSVTGVVNGQLTAVNVTTATNEICLSSATPTDDDAMVYDESVGNGEFYLEIEIDFSGGDKYIVNPVLDVVNDLTNKMEGNEFSSVKMQHLQGTNFGILSDITDEVNGHEAISLGELRESGDSGTYKITFTVDESNLDDGADIVYFVIDDNGEHNGQDILSGTKATASALITLKSQA